MADVLEDLDRYAAADRVAGFVARHVVDDAPPDLDRQMARIRPLPRIFGAGLVLVLSILLWWLIWRGGAWLIASLAGA